MCLQKKAEIMDASAMQRALTRIAFQIIEKNHGAKNIFLSECPSMVINPTVMKEFTELFEVKITNNPKNDLESIKLE